MMYVGGNNKINIYGVLRFLENYNIMCMHIYQLQILSSLPQIQSDNFHEAGRSDTNFYMYTLNINECHGSN